MRNLLALIGTVVVLFVGLGWYFKWYTFVLTPGTDGKQHISVEVDTKKMTEDTKTALSKAGNAIQSASDGQKAAPAEFVGPPLPSDMPLRVPSTLNTTGTTSSAPPPRTPFQISVPGPIR